MQIVLTLLGLIFLYHIVIGDDFHTETDLFVACTILQKQIEIIAGKTENIIIPSEHVKKPVANPETGILLNNPDECVLELKQQFFV